MTVHFSSLYYWSSRFKHERPLRSSFFGFQFHTIILCAITFDFSMDHNHVKHFCLIVRNWKVICCEFQIAETMSSRVAESSKVLKQFNQFQSVQSVSKHFIFRNHSFLTISGSLPGCTLFYHKFLHVPYLQRDPVTSSIVHEWHTFFGTKYI